MSQNNLMKMVLIGIIVILVVLGGYFAWSKKSNNLANVEPVVNPIVNTNTSNWKTYKFTRLGVEFQYPNDYEVRDSGRDVITITKGFHQVSQIYLRSGTTTQEIQSIKNGGFLSENKKIIGGVEGTQIIANNVQEAPTSSVYNILSVNGVTYQINFYGVTGWDVPYNEILSTFKFTK